MDYTKNAPMSQERLLALPSPLPELPPYKAPIIVRVGSEKDPNAAYATERDYVQRVNGEVFIFPNVWGIQWVDGKVYHDLETWMRMWHAVCRTIYRRQSKRRL